MTLQFFSKVANLFLVLRGDAEGLHGKAEMTETADGDFRSSREALLILRAE